MKDIRDYLPFYLGCQYRISYIETPDRFTVWSELTAARLAKLEDHSIAKIEIQLRPLSSMTEEEQKQLEATKAFQRATPVHRIGIRVWTAESYRWAFKNHFDVFELIPEGIAIDKTIINQP